VEIGRCKGPGETGAILPRKGLYSSHLVQCRRARQKLGDAGLAPKKRGPKTKVSDERDRKIAELERDNSKLKTRARKAEALVEGKNMSRSCLGSTLPTAARRNREGMSEVVSNVVG